MGMFIIGLIRLLLLIFILYILYKILWKGEGFKIFKKMHKKGSLNKPEKMRKDEICGTYIPQSQAKRLKHKNIEYYFCSEKCRNKFRESIKSK